MSCVQLQHVEPPIELARTDAGGTVGAQTAILYVRPGGPKLKVAVEVYFRPTTKGGTIPASGNTMSYAPAVVEKRGDVLALADVETGITLPAGREFATASELLIFTCSLSKVGAEAGAWFARVVVKPMPGVCEGQFKEALAEFGASRVSRVLLLA